MNSRSNTVRVARVLSTDLALRETARDFILYLSMLPEPEVVIDFRDVRSVTRSFAHEYCTRMRDVHKRIREANISPNVAKMFAVVQTAHYSTPSRSRINFDSIPVINL